MLSPSRLKTKIYALIALVGVVFIALGFWTAQQTREALLNGRKVELQHLTDVVSKTLLDGQHQVADGKMSVTDAQAMVKQRVSTMHYGSDGYSGVLSDSMVMLVHPNPAMVNHNANTFKTVDNKFVFHDFVVLGQKQGDGFYTYDFPRPGSDKAELKLSYYRYDPVWHWTTFTGVYVADIDAEYHHLLIVQMGLIAVILVALIAIIHVGMRRLVLTPIAQVVMVCEAIAEGDLTHSIPTASSMEIGQLLTALGSMQARLATTVTSIRASSTFVDNAAHEVFSGNADLSQRTEEQAAALEETASSMEEITTAVAHNSQNAQQAIGMARGAHDVADKGRAIVQQVIQTMGGIDESSRNIAEVIGMIEAIAFQTNILALNASVEAARAGEQGRGFAVVATEVRNLAQRSAQAAKETKALIHASDARVKEGNRLVIEAGNTMDEVGTATQRVTDIMGEIASASQEQAQGVQQVSSTIAQMDEVTQQNAALVEQAAAAARSLQEQAEALRQAVDVFRT